MKTVLRTCIIQLPPQKLESYHLAEPRDDLLEVPAMVEQARMMGVSDCGSQINVLSDRFMHKCGLPVITEGIECYKITGVSGGLAHCVGVIPNAQIYVTDKELETIGELVVIEHAGFDLLLGRPWITMNCAGTHEEDDGTYLSFRSEGEQHNINTSPSSSFSKKDEGIQAWMEPLPPIRATCMLGALDSTTEFHRPDCKSEHKVPLTNAPVKDQELQEVDL